MRVRVIRGVVYHYTGVCREMTRFILPFAAGLAIASAAHAQVAEWQLVAQQCAAEAEQKFGCTTACVNQTWPNVARCVNLRLRRPMPQALIERCIVQTNQARSPSACELCGDPVSDVLACASE